MKMILNQTMIQHYIIEMWWDNISTINVEFFKRMQFSKQKKHSEGKWIFMAVRLRNTIRSRILLTSNLFLKLNRKFRFGKFNLNIFISWIGCTTQQIHKPKEKKIEFKTENADEKKNCATMWMAQVENSYNVKKRCMDYVYMLNG